MKKATVKQLQLAMTRYLKTIAREPVVITLNQKPVAMLVSIDDPNALQGYPADLKVRLRTILEQSRADIRRGEGIPFEEFKRRWKTSKNGKKPKTAELQSEKG